MSASRSASSTGARVGVAPHREVRELARLFRGGLRDLGAAVTDLADEQSREAVEILLAAVVVHPRAFAAHDHRHVAVVGHAREVHPQMAAGKVGKNSHHVPQE